MSSRYFFDIYDGQVLTSDEVGVVCKNLEDLSYQAVDVLPHIIREQLPDGSRRTFYVKVRDEADQYVFRATLTLASAWVVDNINGKPQPGGDRWMAALSKARLQVAALRREFAEDGFSPLVEGLDSVFSVAEAEVDRLLARGSASRI